MMLSGAPCEHEFGKLRKSAAGKLHVTVTGWQVAF